MIYFIWKNNENFDKNNQYGHLYNTFDEKSSNFPWKILTIFRPKFCKILKNRHAVGPHSMFYNNIIAINSRLGRRKIDTASARASEGEKEASRKSESAEETRARSTTAETLKRDSLKKCAKIRREKERRRGQPPGGGRGEGGTGIRPRPSQSPLEFYWMMLTSGHAFEMVGGTFMRTSTRPFGKRPVLENDAVVRWLRTHFEALGMLWFFLRFWEYHDVGC